jgi:hypothetical protein
LTSATGSSSPGSARPCGVRKRGHGSPGHLTCGLRQRSGVCSCSGRCFTSRCGACWNWFCCALARMSPRSSRSSYCVISLTFCAVRCPEPNRSLRSASSSPPRAGCSDAASGAPSSSHETLVRWHRELIARRWSYAHRHRSPQPQSAPHPGIRRRRVMSPNPTERLHQLADLQAFSLVGEAGSNWQTCRRLRVLRHSDPPGIPLLRSAGAPSSP